MNEEEVKNRIRELREDARDKEIYSKAADIAARLGERFSKKHGAWHTFTALREEGKITISWDDYGSNMLIDWSGETVFSTQLGEVKAYRPDIPHWFDLLNEVFTSKILPNLQREKANQRSSRSEELQRKWGIQS